MLSVQVDFSKDAALSQGVEWRHVPLGALFGFRWGYFWGGYATKFALDEVIKLIL